MTVITLNVVTVVFSSNQFSDASTDWVSDDTFPDNFRHLIEAFWAATEAVFDVALETVATEHSMHHTEDAADHLDDSGMVAEPEHPVENISNTQEGDDAILEQVIQIVVR